MSGDMGGCTRMTRWCTAAPEGREGGRGRGGREGEGGEEESVIMRYNSFAAKSAELNLHTLLGGHHSTTVPQSH